MWGSLELTSTPAGSRDGWCEWRVNMKGGAVKPVPHRSTFLFGGGGEAVLPLPFSLHGWWQRRVWPQVRVRERNRQRTRCLCVLEDGRLERGLPLSCQSSSMLDLQVPPTHFRQANYRPLCERK